MMGSNGYAYPSLKDAQRQMFVGDGNMVLYEYALVRVHRVKVSVSATATKA